MNFELVYMPLGGGVASNTYHNHDKCTFAVTGTLTYSQLPTARQVTAYEIIILPIIS